MMLYVCYPKCSTCKKAEQYLNEKEIEIEVRDIKLNNPSKEELKSWIEKSGLDIKRFFNTSGLKYKELNLKEKLPEMSDEEKIELLSTDGMLVKRPILISDEFVLVGFRQPEWDQVL
ncbi:MAG: arsenate reductase family protein [Erysipelotrichaceae bacterium]|nr:arsenate reductase family protein [Erysipelotrichaceae bacterium]